MRCLVITCLCMLSFLLNDFSQTEQNQLMSTSQEQSLDREKGRMLRIYIGLFLLLDLPSFTTTTFLLFSSSITIIAFLMFTFSTTTTTTFLYFLPPPLPPHFYCFLPPLPPPHFYFFPSSHSTKDRKLPQLVQFVCLKLSRTATPLQLHALVQVLYNYLRNTFTSPKKISGKYSNIKML